MEHLTDDDKKLILEALNAYLSDLCIDDDIYNRDIHQLIAKLKKLF